MEDEKRANRNSCWFVDKTYVHRAADFNDQRIPPTNIEFNFIGELDLPMFTLEDSKEKSA